MWRNLIPVFSKQHPNIEWIRAVGAMIGGVIGVGIFGIPYTFAQSGFVLGAIELFVIAFLILVLLLMLSEVAIQTPGKHRLIGYMRVYLGKKWAFVMLWAFAISLWGAMIAYLIIGGGFLHTLFSPIFGGDRFIYQILIILPIAFLTAHGVRYIAKVELYIIGALLFLFGFITLAAIPYIDLSNLTTVSYDQFFLPYGVLIFAFGGLGMVPEIKDILGKKQEWRLAHAVIAGHLIIAAIYLFFSLAVLGVTGSMTTESAFDGLIPVLGPVFAIVGSFLGALTIISIFSLLSIQLQDTFQFDYGMKKLTAWLFVLSVPLILFLLGVREFIELIGFMGSIFGGLTAISVILMYQKMRKSPICRMHRCINIPQSISFLLMALFVLGIIWTIIDSLL